MPFATTNEWRSSWRGEWGEFRDKTATRKAMTVFDALKGTEIDRMRTLQRIMTACLSAKLYDPELDPGQKYRSAIAAQRKSMQSLAAAARVLAKACERNDKAMMWALPGGLNDFGVSLKRPHDGRTTPICEMGAAWFSELENTLSGKLPELNGGPFFYRFTVGNMHFEKPVKAGRPIGVVSMLAFELAFYLRMFTAGRASDSWADGQRMPIDGKPCTAVIAAFCKASLGSSLSARQVAYRLNKLPTDAGLIGWKKVE